MTFPASLAHALQQSQEWLHELRDNGGLVDSTEALAVLRVVLHHLRDRLTFEEAVDLGAQLPIFIRGLYYEGWKPHKVPRKIDKLEKLLDEVTIDLLPRTVPPERAIRDVFAILAHHCDPGEISHVIGQMPEEIKNLWPKSAQTFKERLRH